jgi:hypothetical protein
MLWILYVADSYEIALQISQIQNAAPHVFEENHCRHSVGNITFLHAENDKYDTNAHTYQLSTKP